MADITKIDDNGLAKVLAGGVDTLPKPFSQDIFLLEFHVAGSYYVSNMKEIAPELAVGQQVTLCREEENSHDNQAILVLDEKKRKIGYVPRNMNTVPSHLMDAGKLLIGKIAAIHGNFDIVVKLFMQE